MSTYQGKVGIVTGGASGIGRAAAVAFGREKATVVVADIESSRTAGLETIEMIKEAGGQGMFIATNVTKSDEVKKMVEQTVDNYGRLDFAFNNAGIIETGYTAEMDEAGFDRVIDVNLKGVFLCMKYELQYMQENGGGSIVNTSSTSGFTGSPTGVAYVASKHAINGMIKVAASEYAGLNIRVNGVAPGVIRTPMVDALTPEQLKRNLSPQPMQWPGEPEDVAEAVLFLASEKAKYITGTVLMIDGGAVANSQSFDPEINLMPK